MQVAVTGIDSVTELADALTVGQSSEDAIRQFTSAYTEALDRVTPRRTGDLRNSVQVNISGSQALIEATAPYALYVVLGVRAQWMTWMIGHTVSFTAKDGQVVTRRVTRVGVWGGKSHWWRPASPPNDIFQKALQDAHVQDVLAELADAGMPLQVAYSYQAGD